jgi:ComF family protein
LPVTTRPAVMPGSALVAARKVVCGLLDLLFPDNCRVCEEPLVLNQPPFEVSRIPVCNRCLKAPELFDAEFFCVACRTPFVNEAPLDESGRCSLCRLGVNGFDQVYTFGAYEGTLRKLIHIFKFEGVQTLQRPLGALLAQVLPREMSFDAIVPMPLHWRRRWQRGFNQSELLAREISRRWSVPVSSAVRRKKATAPQAGLTSSQRRKNMQGAFAVKAGKPLTGMRVLLIDDVLTTGATASACARALKRAGASHVTFLALARRDRRAAFEFGIEIPNGAAAADSRS